MELAGDGLLCERLSDVSVVFERTAAATISIPALPKPLLDSESVTRLSLLRSRCATASAPALDVTFGGTGTGTDTQLEPPGTGTG
mmetsp:Transcript_56434/g.115481  ORF Transcript_56434/g.115481 Transcript_56434/m.115481 type:complete len:85 (-) Transcript_56434:1072-1326(-)